MADQAGFGRVALAENLPVFRAERPGETWFYAPGCLAVASSCEANKFQAALQGQAGAFAGEASRLLTAARLAQAAWRTRASGSFTPVCLTVYLSNACNLGCTYCFSAPRPARARQLTLAQVLAAANQVIANCARRDLPFTLVFQGGGEPALHFELIAAILKHTHRQAGQAGIGTFRYIATNGVLPEGRARWLAENFDRVGLSCDGPAAIQNRQRPRRDGGETSAFVERTARILKDHGREFDARVTVTAKSANQQPEIADYICQVLAPGEIHVEPAYRPNHTLFAAKDDFVFDSQAFVSGFQAARKIAESYSVRWTTSGTRPGEIHGPYCHFYRDVLNLVPGGAATACFKQVERDQAKQAGVDTGCYINGEWILDIEKIQGLQERLNTPPSECQDCLNIFHCTWGCPDACPLAGESPVVPPRCEVMKGLALVLLGEAAEALRMGAGPGVRTGKVGPW